MFICNLTRGLSIITILLVIETALSLKVPTEISNYLAKSVCQQKKNYDQFGIIQIPVIKKPRPSSDEKCGWHRFSNCGVGTCKYKQFVKCREVEKTHSKIVGGEDAPLHGFPSMLALFIKGRYFCGAIIINKDWVVTAAHCLLKIKESPKKASIIAGDHKLNSVDLETEQKSRCQRIFIHPNYVDQYPKLVNDIALCKLETPLTFNEHVQPALLPDSNYRATGNVTAVGWGMKSEGGRPSNILQQVELTTINDTYCQELYNWREMTEKEICTLLPGKDGCQGDSGGPLYYQHNKNAYVLVGITSWGRGCARPEFPGVWAEVAYFVPWINDIISLL